MSTWSGSSAPAAVATSVKSNQESSAVHGSMQSKTRAAPNRESAALSCRSGDNAAETARRPRVARVLLFQCIEKRCTMIQGLITSKDVFLSGAVIVREFGIATWLRCCLVLLSGRHPTSLEVVFNGGRRPDAR